MTSSKKSGENRDAVGGGVDTASLREAINKPDTPFSREREKGAGRTLFRQPILVDEVEDSRRLRRCAASHCGYIRAGMKDGPRKPPEVSHVPFVFRQSAGGNAGNFALSQKFERAPRIRVATHAVGVEEMAARRIGDEIDGFFHLGDFLGIFYFLIAKIEQRGGRQSLALGRRQRGRPRRQIIAAGNGVEVVGRARGRRGLRMNRSPLDGFAWAQMPPP
jgi:hypothetical protein